MDMGQTDQTQVPGESLRLKGQDEIPLEPLRCVSMLPLCYGYEDFPLPCPVEASIGLRQVDFH